VTPRACRADVQRIIFDGWCGVVSDLSRARFIEVVQALRTKAAMPSCSAAPNAVILDDERSPLPTLDNASPRARRGRCRAGPTADADVAGRPCSG
jgi:hypothetical protein